MIVENFVLK